jgi:hypothetical protein
MQECETGTGKGSFTKRVSVRSGGAGHAHSGVTKKWAAGNSVAKAPKAKVFKLGR